MDDRTKYLLLRTVQDDNILPLTSACNMRCLFCSHRNNPPGLQVYRFGHLPLELLKELIDFLSPGEPVIIGESATRIIEGEPFLHPEFKTVLKLLRRRWPDKVIRLTTNGSLLSRQTAAFLGRISPLELNISVNCADPEERVFLMKDPLPEGVFKGLEYISKEGLRFSGSIVAAPHLLGPDSLERTLSRLAGFCPETVRVFLPGFTRYAAGRLKFETESFYRQLSREVERLGEQYAFPIILEPPVLEDFSSRIKGIITGTPAAALPLRRGDIILKVDERAVETRVDCFQRLLAAADPRLEVERGEEKRRFSCVLKKERGERPGLVLDYDLEPRVLEQLNSSILKYREGAAADNGFFKVDHDKVDHDYDKISAASADRRGEGGDDSREGVGIQGGGEIVLVTSTLAEVLIKSLTRRLRSEFPENSFGVLTVQNKYFGGSIGTAGLLTNQDIENAFLNRPELRPGLIFLPGIIYDIFGKDLTGKDYKALTKNLHGEVIIV